MLWKCSLYTGDISNTGSPALLGEMKAEPVSLMTSLAMRPGLMEDSDVSALCLERFIKEEVV